MNWERESKQIDQNWLLIPLTLLFICRFCLRSPLRKERGPLKSWTFSNPIKVLIIVITKNNNNNNREKRLSTILVVTFHTSIMVKTRRRRFLNEFIEPWMIFEVHLRFKQQQNKYETEMERCEWNHWFKIISIKRIVNYLKVTSSKTNSWRDYSLICCSFEQKKKKTIDLKFD